MQRSRVDFFDRLTGATLFCVAPAVYSRNLGQLDAAAPVLCGGHVVLRLEAGAKIRQFAIADQIADVRHWNPERSRSAYVFPPKSVVVLSRFDISYSYITYKLDFCQHNSIESRKNQRFVQKRPHNFVQNVKAQKE